MGRRKVATAVMLNDLNGRGIASKAESSKTRKTEPTADGSVAAVEEVSLLSSSAVAVLAILVYSDVDKSSESSQTVAKGGWTAQLNCATTQAGIQEAKGSQMQLHKRHDRRIFQPGKRH